MYAARSHRFVRQRPRWHRNRIAQTHIGLIPVYAVLEKYRIRALVKQKEPPNQKLLLPSGTSIIHQKMYHSVQELRTYKGEGESEPPTWLRTAARTTNLSKSTNLPTSASRNTET